MRPSTFVTISLLIIVAWGSLFITVLNQSHQTHTLLINDHVLLNQDTTILNAERNTQTNLEAKIADLQAHVDCLFNLATQPNPGSSHISNASKCTITSSLGGATGTTKSNSTIMTPTKTSTTTSSTAKAPTTTAKPTPTPATHPVRSLLDRLTGGIL